MYKMGVQIPEKEESSKRVRIFKILICNVKYERENAHKKPLSAFSYRIGNRNQSKKIILQAA